MKLALIVRRLSLDGGTERFVAGLSQWLIAAGHRIDVWCAGSDIEVKGAVLRKMSPRGRGRMGRLWSFARACRVIDRSEYDAVLGFVRVPGTDLYRAGGGCHQAWMQTRGWSLADRVELSYDRAAVSTARIVVVNSAMAGRELNELYGLDEERIRLVHNGVDLERFRPAEDVDLGLPRPLVGFLGNGFQRKGLATAMRAVATLDGVHLVVWGADRRAARYRRLATRLGIGDRVHVRGPLSRPEEHLPGLDAFVLPTHYDPFANVCLESMACGVPVVTSGRNGAAEVLPEEWMVVEDPVDTSGFATALERVLQTDDLRQAVRLTAEAWPAENAFAQVAALTEELCT